MPKTMSASAAKRQFGAVLGWVRENGDEVIVASPLEGPHSKFHQLHPLLLAGVFALTLVLRVIGLGWGMPDYTPGLLADTPIRTSYHLDEDNYLRALVRMHAGANKFDVGDYHWGTLQFYLIFGVLEVAEKVGAIPAPWQAAFMPGDTAVLPRLYLLGRLVSLAAGVAATAAVVALGSTLAGRAAGLVAGVAYAVAPLGVVEAHYLTSDVTMSALVAAAVLAATAAVQRGRLRWLLAAALLLGLATAAKYSAVFAAPALVAAQWAFPRQGGRGHRLARMLGPGLAAAVGFVLGEPYALLAPQSVLQGLRQTAGNSVDLAAGLTAPLGMLGWQAMNLAALGLTWPLAMLAVAGLVVLLVRSRRRRRPPAGPASAGAQEPEGRRASAGVVLLAAVGGLGVGLMLNRVFVLRYSEPLVPLLAVAAAVGWEAVSRPVLRAAAGGVALASALAITLGQLVLLSGPHTANLLDAWLQAHVPPGQQVARAWPQYPVLDGHQYKLVRIDPGLPALPPGSDPDYIIIDNMEFAPPTPGLAQRLTGAYQVVASFSAQPHLGPLTWDEGTTPHDWKYSHPGFVVYARR